MKTIRISPRSDDPDGPIVERIRQGETYLFEILVRRYNQRLHRVARAFLHDEPEVEDVMQEAYLRAFANLSRFQGKALFSTWLTRILVNCAQARIRSRFRKPEVALDILDEQGAAIATETNEEQRLEIRQLLEQAIDRLPEKYRVVFVMRELEKASVAETAASLGLSQVNVKVRQHRAKRLLRESLRRQIPEIVLYGFDDEGCDRMAKRVMEELTQLADRSGKFPPGVQGSG